ncbi:MAG TPA: DUF748 domain-containing protein [Verrucomicrobiae bacterium]|nr:DUF748 domain-containing protein [Verrucomicrobiae bacterium]
MKAPIWNSLSPRRRKFAFWILGLLLFYTVAGFLILPPIVRVIAVKQLSRQLDRQVSIEKIKINPFALSTTVRGLLIKDKDGQPFISWDEVYVNFQLSSFLGHPWIFKEISTSKPYVHVKINADGTFNFSDILARLSTGAAPAKPKTEARPLAVCIEQLRVEGARADLENRRAAGNPPVAGENHPPGMVENTTTNAVNRAATDSSAANLSLLLSVTNAVALLLDNAKQLSGTVNNVDVTNCAVHLEDWAHSRPAKLDLSDITLAAKNISNLPVTNLTAQLSLRWNKDGSIKVATTVLLRPLTAEVQLDLDQLDLGTLDPYLEPKLDLFILSSQAGLHGKVSVHTPENQLPEITFSGDARLDHFHTVDGVMAEDLLKWDSLRVSGIDVNLNPETVTVREIAVDNAYARLVIETNQTINLFNALRLTNAPPTNQTQVAVANSSGTTRLALPQISVGSVAISNTTVNFTDRSLQPNVNMVIEKAGGTISGISSEQLQHADVNLHAIVDGIGPADITGTINPFSGTLTNDIKVSVKDVDLTPTGPYSAKFAGYSIAEGKLNLDLNYELVGKKLNAKNVITLDQFTFGEQVNSPDATHLPVRLAIAILKDREGKIILDVPVNGSLDDPRFRIGKVVQRAIVNILEKVATSPFSLIGAAFGGGGEELGYQDFAPAGRELTGDDTRKLDVLAKALYARPGLQMEIVGSIDPRGDREGLQRAALDKQIRTQVWMKLRKSEQSATSVERITLSPDDRARWIKKLYGEAVADGKITPQLIAADTNLAAYAALVLPRKLTEDKGATKLMTLVKNETATNTVYQTKLVPPPDPMEAVLLATFPVAASDLGTLAADRAKTVRAYLLATGKVEAKRLFLMENQTGGVRSNGSRVYLQFR